MSELKVLIQASQGYIHRAGRVSNRPNPVADMEIRPTTKTQGNNHENWGPIEK
jgi:hypothetical protein